MGKPHVVDTKLLGNMVLTEFYELVAAAEVNSWFKGLHFCAFSLRVYTKITVFNRIVDYESINQTALGNVIWMSSVKKTCIIIHKYFFDELVSGKYRASFGQAAKAIVEYAKKFREDVENPV